VKKSRKNTFYKHWFWIIWDCYKNW